MRVDAATLARLALRQVDTTRDHTSRVSEPTSDRRMGTRSGTRQARQRVVRDKSLTRAYERVAKACDVTVAEVRAVFNHDQFSGQLMQPGVVRALEMLQMKERQLEDSFRHCVMVANRLNQRIQHRPRFRAYHTYSSIRSAAGFPDWVLIDRKLPCMYVFEFKTERNEETQDQGEWLADLLLVGESSNGHVQVLGVIRPSNFQVVIDKLDLSGVGIR